MPIKPAIRCEQIADADLAIGADLKDLAGPPSMRAVAINPRQVSFDKREVPVGGQVAKPNLLCLGSHLANNRWDHGPGRLPRTISVKRTGDDHW